MVKLEGGDIPDGEESYERFSIFPNSAIFTLSWNIWAILYVHIIDIFWHILVPYGS